MSRSSIRHLRIAVLVALVGAPGPLAAPASGAGAACNPPVPSPPECGSSLPQVLNVGLPYTQGVPLEDLERSLRSVIGGRYLECARCPERPLRVNVALGTDYQILDWLDRGLVDLGVVPDVSLELLRRDGLDLLEIAGVGAGEMVQLVGRKPEVALSWVEGGKTLERTGTAKDLERYAGDLWAHLFREEGGEEAPDPGRLVMPSHLSSAGFLDPMLTLEDLLDSDALPDASPERRRRFWDELYARTCFRFGPGLGRRDTACAPRAGSPRLEVTVVEDAPGDDELEGPRVLLQDRYRDRLVIRQGAADSVFAPDAFGEVRGTEEGLLGRLREKLGRTVEGPDGRPIALPSAFDGFLIPDRYFGTRTFAFRVGETLDLIELHQHIASRASLSLVLPGGGVKAAYQSRVLDALYGSGAAGAPGLANSGARGAPPVPSPGGPRVTFASAPAPGSAVVPGASDPGPVPPLEVDSVVGTSGGALLGFFVARLGPRGPVDLSTILWKPGASDDPERPYLTATEIFGWTDLPRYVSLVLILGIFGLVVAFFSWRRNGFLSPERRPEDEASDPEPAVRWAVVLTIAALLGVTPLVVSWVSGPLADEHVPEFEGLLYAVLLVLGTFADQCLVRREAYWAGGGREDEEEGRRLDLRAVLPMALLVLGGALVAGPVLVRWLAPGFAIRGTSVLEGRVTTGGAYLVLGSITAGLALLAVGWRRLKRFGWWNLLAWPAVFLVGTLVAWGILRAVGEGFLDRVDRTPLLFLALGAALLMSVLLRLVRNPEVQRRHPLLKGIVNRASGVARTLFGHRVAYFLGVGAVGFLGCLIVLDLTRPPAEAFVETGLADLLFAESKLDAPRGPLAVCLGAVFLLLGTILTLHRRRNHYRLEDDDRFRDSVLVVITGLAFAVYLGLWLVVRLIEAADHAGWFEGSSVFARFATLTLFELTPSFWKGLAVASLVGALVLVRWAYVGDRRPEGTLSKLVARSLAYLGSAHPNAHLVSSRVVRLGAMAIGGLLWWNFVLAPALYGNRYAFEYLEGAEARFDAAYRAEHDASSYGLTARYLAPANALSIDGTRFVLAVPGGDDCPAVPASPGVVWRGFRIAASGAGSAGGAAAGPAGATSAAYDCREISLDDADQRRELQNYIFASGSPFPAFPPKRVRVFGDTEDDEIVREALVDGGYSNNVPIEAASKIGARQALVIHSSNPRPTPSGEGWMARLGGPLVDNVPRLLGFLYERSQQLDRRSRSDLFVASLAPPPAEDWPLLTDFRSATVERMIRQAGEDLERRIGMVESWGPPEFQTSLRVPVDCPDECGAGTAADPGAGDGPPMSRDRPDGRPAR